MSERVPEGWEFVSLSQLDLDISDGNYSSKYPTSDEFVKVGVPFLRANNIGSIKVNPKNIRFISNKKHAELKKGHLKNGDILISTRGEIGKVCVVQDAFVDANINAQLVRVNGGQKLNSFFLFHILRSDSSVQQLADLQTGTALKQLPVGNFLKLTIPFMPYREQKKIASILTSVDEVIETTQKQIDKLQDLKKATMNELLTKGIGHTEFKDSELGRIPKSWGINQLGDYVKCQGGNAFPSSEFGKIGIPVVRISNIKNGLVDLSGCVHFSESEQFERFIVFEGEILLAMSGATTGKIGVYKAKSPAYLNQRVGRFRIEDKKNVDSAFLNHLVQSEIFADATLRDAIGGAQPNISSSQVESVIYAFPTLSEQKVIASILNSVDHKIDVQNAKLNQTQSLKKSLMQDLLTGKVRVQVN